MKINERAGENKMEQIEKNEMPGTEKVMVAMSGGVDSSVAASLLLEQGFELCGATLKLFENEDIGISDKERTCCSLTDVQDAKTVATKLGFRHYVFNFGLEFQRDVIRRFGEAYARGETPNPCIDCNRYIKFSKMIERALLLGYDKIATGHYARVEFDSESGRYLLKKAKDVTKDQTYVLYPLTQNELSRTLFPLGGLLKSEIRELADARGLINARKPDSQDICFVKDGDYAGFIENVLKISSPEGNFVDGEGNVLGRHKGLIHYTIGQRRGLKLSFDNRKYVVRLDSKNNTVVLGENEELFHDSFYVGDLNFISIETLKEPKSIKVKTRYKQPETEAMIYPAEEGRVFVKLEKPQRAITAGQAAVFYDGDNVVGGGTILG